MISQSLEATTPVIGDLVLTLRKVRRELRISQLDLAARVGVSEITVVEWEKRRDIPATGNLFRWAIELGYVVKIEESLSGDILREPDPTSKLHSVETWMIRISNALKQARLKTGLTQEELGDKLGVSTWTIRMWESTQRTPRLAHLVAWCTILNCQLALANA